MTDPDDRFGMPASAFKAARESHGLDSPVFRAGMYVPTRHEVATLSATQLLPIVIDWMWESPSELIPDNKQIGELRALLAARPDADEPTLRELITACDDYLKI
ncbi:MULTISPECIES: hypothetical protein [Pseudomonadota]|uniref:XRE family transcriptional regulator n=1 Tax=Rhodanobacter humi TaxID=1888173 RepID=A0ABV4AVQ5_9GAMM|nr:MULTISPECIES: hypothetical protein [Pseudomonadota]TAN24942.1 MAG: hypothetical protein EPN31_16420 [Castellaniella sp.]UJJ52988.1 hypothetical protein LRK52_18990 [Rhodanobacter denitrificans]UJJ60537.1 hypothetical protein LRK55_19070 [Rhodanobacter denitrificans]UJM93764.1 hypothetical protein LRK32_17650 [Rhodanobacter denitrificans]UJM97295.1 hypothetical protein LRK44_17660 [Rhodanobacter denitrificans]